MNIGVSGASGNLGQAVIAELTRRGDGHMIVGISRSPNTVQSPAKGRHGDYDHHEALAAAYEHLDSLLIIPSSDMRPGIRDRQFVTAINAAVRAGVQHIVLISSATTRESTPHEMYAAYFTAEQHLMKTAQHWSILRTNYYAESFAQMAGIALGSGVISGLGESRVAFVSRDDVAAAAAGILIGLGHVGSIYNATGPAAVTGAERAALLSEITGKPVRFAILEEEQLRGGLLQAGVPPQYIKSLIDIENHFVSGSYDIITGDVERLARRLPQTLSQVLSRQFSAD